jgi:hypothetical protein
MQDKLCFLSSVAMAALLAATLAFVQGARARNLNGEHDNDPHKDWYEAQRNKAGGSCCADGDGHPFFGVYTFTAEGGVEFDADGVHHVLTAYMVLDGPNPTGHVVWWWIDWQTNGGAIAHADHCFAPGARG